MKAKMSKAEATRFFKSLLGSGHGTSEVVPNQKYAVRSGQIVYSVELADNWPFGTKLKLTAFIAEQQVISGILFDRDKHLPWDEPRDRKNFSAKIQRAIENTKPSDMEE